MVDLIRPPSPVRGPLSTRSERAFDPWWRRIDWVLAVATVVLAVVGSLLVWSATRVAQIDAGADPRYYFKRHLLNFALGAVLGVIVSAVDYRVLRRSAPLVYLASCLGLLAVLAIGTTINGAHSWIRLPAGFELQPSEFAKLGLIVSIALLLAERRRRDDLRHGLDVPLALALAAAPMGLIMLQPDVGTVFVFVFVIFAMLSVAGVSWRWIVGLVAAGVVVAYLSVSLHILKSYQLDRFRAFTNPAEQQLGAGYNVHQAKIAIGAGGLTGTGLFHGSQTNGRFVPEQQTDFIFTVAGEELGLLGAGAVIVLFGLVLWRALRIAGHSPDLFGRLVGVGIAGWFICQIFINIGMALGIMPVTGLPLPFLSYGGSAMFANCIAVGMLQNVHMRNAIAPSHV